jgi:hypothetical protein
MTYLNNLLSACSQLANAALLGGHPNESISGRCYREGWQTAMRVVNAIFFWQSHHCRGAYASDREWAEHYMSLPERIERAGE